VRGGLCRDRYAAVQTTTASFASSDGWKTSGPTSIQRRAPLIPLADREHPEAEHESRHDEARRDCPEPLERETRDDDEQCTPMTA
jgi:hypothetical protein